MVDIALIGATGTVGQKVIALLSRQSHFNIREVIASDARIGQEFSSVTSWREPLSDLPSSVAKLCFISAHNIQSPYVISCLSGDLAREIEPVLATRGHKVFSNASAYRMDPKVPLLIPEINEDHLILLSQQESSGKIITNPNCSAVGIALALAPLRDITSFRHVSAVTMQSVSGAGYPGISSLDIMGNTIPHIEGEAVKIIEETKKILGSPTDSLNFPMTVHVHRVPVVYGHTATLHIHVKDSLNLPDIIHLYQSWNKRHGSLFCLYDQAGLPQALRNLKHDDMRVHIGHVTYDSENLIVSMVILSHNLVRGAAGAVLHNIAAYERHGA